MASILKDLLELQPYMQEIRRELHRYPELSSQEFETQKRIMRELDAMNISYRKVGNTSLVAQINPGKGKTVALRADIDALPILEEAEIDFVSENPGVMHACGHDAHTAMLLGAARWLQDHREELQGEVRLIFQEAEETFSGAKLVVAEGGVDGVDALFALHNMPTLNVGEVEVHPGYKFAGADTIFIKFEGVSGHGSMPHKAKDALHAACLFVTDIQGIVTKNVDAQEPVVLNVGRMVGGTKANIVPKFVELDISMRYFDQDVRKLVHAALKRHGEAIAGMYELSFQMEVDEASSTYSLYNDEAIAKIAGEAAEKIFGAGQNKKTKPLMGSEDVPFYFEKVKGAYALLGAYNEAKGAVYFPHHEKFTVDEDIFPLGAALHVQFVLDFFASA